MRKRATKQAAMFPAALSTNEPVTRGTPAETNSTLTVIPMPTQDPRVKPAVGIFDLTSGISMVKWLCSEHLAARTAPGPLQWTAKKIGDVDGECGDCRLRVDRSAIGPPTTRANERTKEKAA